MARTILVVDDDPMVREVTVAMLEDLGCVVIPAATGAEALAALSSHGCIEILITDINMPGMGGYELAERARRLRKNLQVILLSGRESDGHGFPLIRKPFLERDLLRVMADNTGLC